MPMLRAVPRELKDGENNPVLFDVAYRVSGHGLADTVARIYGRHGPDTCLLPMSATSAGGGVFQQTPSHGEPVVGILVEPAPNPKIRKEAVSSLDSVSLDEIVIDQETMQVCAGGAITIDQLNRSLAETVSPAFRVPGSDLTSYAYAQVGSTFMTGGMGPQRRYFSDSVIEIALHSGRILESIGQDRLSGYAGTYGWTGLVGAVRCRYVRLPQQEIAFAVPVRNDPSEIAALLEHLSGYCFFEFEQETAVNLNGGPDVVTGLEHITVESMGPLIHDSPDWVIALGAGALAGMGRAAGADGVMFVSGCISRPADEFLEMIVDNVRSDSFAIAGISLDSAEVFRTADEMRELREAIPFAARVREPEGEFRYKNHTDANVRLNPGNIAGSATALWERNQRYVEGVESLIRGTGGLRGDILVYGHMNPYGVDPHNRLTLSADTQEVMQEAVESATALRAEFYRQLGEMCETTGSRMIGGEKGADSEHAILRAFGNPALAPRELSDKFRRQSETVTASMRNFNWRAFELYRDPPDPNPSGP